MSEWDGAERRKCSRKNSLIGVSITAINDQSLPYKYDAEMGHNICEEGICLELTKPLSIGEEVKLQILLSEDTKIFTAIGKVTWIDSYRRKEITIDGIRIPAKDNYKAGINFTDISEQDRNEIRKFASEM